MNSEAFTTALRRYWGYDSFRPLQERIVRSIAAGRDVAVVMPTGGGKSLCYQLPALLSAKTAIVVSPLISLMQDQVAQLEEMGIPCAVLNSSIESVEQSKVMREAMRGAYRLLYLSPERLARKETFDWLGRVPLAFFAIDEAHCISEWGHEFRPEYRQLKRVRERFPELPIAAFTASATRPVRHDILHQLGLREPDKYIASFHRANLRYLVRECDTKTHERVLLQALRAHEGESVIVYAPTIAAVEQTVDFLGDHGIRAIAYHGQMEGEERQRNQERWTSDEAPVLVGTLAFGLGINKPGVRMVIHTALPKSLEQFYQEAGRAGRDGASADCVLLWRKKDVGLLAYFCDQAGDPKERQRAWDRYHVIRRFVEAPKCRHKQVCEHFGETPKWASCANCDVCAEKPAWLTPGAGPMPRTRVKTSAPAATPANSELMEFLREWRRETARSAGVKAFMVLTDASLEEICRKRPKTVDQLQRSISGIGAHKAELYGEQILNALERFEAGARVAKQEPEQMASAAEQTLEYLKQGHAIEEIARLRGRQLGTVVAHVAELVESGKVEFRFEWVRAELLERIERAAAESGTQWLRPIKEHVPEATFDEIRLVLAKLKRN